MLAEIQQAREAGALNPLRARVLEAQIKAMSLDPSAMAGVRANDYRQAYQQVIESELPDIKKRIQGAFVASGGKDFMKDPVLAQNYQALLDAEIEKRVYSRFGITDPKMMRTIQDVPKRAAVVGE
jgi:hypothetical protein